MCISIKKMKWNTIKIFQLKHSYHINKQMLSNTCNYKKGLYILINIFIKLATLTVFGHNVCLLTNKCIMSFVCVNISILKMSHILILKNKIGNSV